jgi:hypothetical protein
VGEPNPFAEFDASRTSTGGHVLLRVEELHRLRKRSRMPDWLPGILVTLGLAAVGALATAGVTSFKGSEAYDLARADHDEMVTSRETLRRVEEHMVKQDAVLERLNAHMVRDVSMPREVSAKK